MAKIYIISNGISEDNKYFTTLTKAYNMMYLIAASLSSDFNTGGKEYIDKNIQSGTRSFNLDKSEGYGLYRAYTTDGIIYKIVNNEDNLIILVLEAELS
jgi:hypothetical protein